MTADFDPYYKWLGIPPAEQPPTYYRLLGIRREETDAEVIANAADRMMRQLRKYQSGPQATLSQKLLNEVAQAKYCLSDPEKRAAYEAILDRRQPVASGASHRRSVPPRSVPPRVTALKRNVEIDRRPKKASQRPVIIASLVGLTVGLLTAILVVVILRNSLPVQTANNLQSESNPAQSIAPVELPQIGSGRTIAELSDSPKEASQDDSKTPANKSFKSNKEKELSEGAEDSDEASADKKPSNSDKKEISPVKKEPLRFIPLEIAPKDEYSRFRYQKQPDHFYTADGSTSAYYRMMVQGGSGPLTGLCLEITGSEHQTAMLTNMKKLVKWSSGTEPLVQGGTATDSDDLETVQWIGAIDSLGQGAAATVIDKNENAGWQLQFSDEEPVWAVFVADQPFDPKLLLEFRHSSNAQRLPRFRLWGITGSGTAQEMAQAMRDRKRAEKPFADFVAHGLPEGGSGEVGLGSVFVGKEKLAAQLFGGNSDAAGVSFSLKQIPPAVEDDLQRWEFLLRAGDKQTPVAELTQQEGKLAPLALSWLPAAVQLPEAAVLRNGLLQLQIGEHSRSVPLREVQKLAPLSYSPLKTVRPQIQVPAGVAAEDLRLALKFPLATFGVDRAAVLQVDGADVEKELSIKDDMVLKLDSSWKASVITLSIKTQIQEETEGKAGKKKTKTVALKKTFSELPKLATRIKKGEELLKIIQGVEKYAGRSRLKAEEKREIMMINKRWRDFGLNPRIILNEKQAEKLVKIVNVEIEKIKNRALKLKDLQDWSKQFGRDGVGAIEFRVYSLVDGVPLDLVRSTGWQEK